MKILAVLSGTIGVLLLVFAGIIASYDPNETLLSFFNGVGLIVLMTALTYRLGKKKAAEARQGQPNSIPETKAPYHIKRNQGVDHVQT